MTCPELKTRKPDLATGYLFVFFDHSGHTVRTAATGAS